MGFRIGDLFGMIGGGAWLLKESVNAIGEHAGDRTRHALIEAYFAEHTDPILEERVNAEIENPACREAIWRRLEEYKRDNPVWCKRHEKRGWRDKYTGRWVSPPFGWQSIGVERIPFRDEKGRLYGKNQYEAMVLRGNRNRVLNLLMHTHGKMSMTEARYSADEKFPMPKSTRSW
jgi:hypothetical protein